MMKKAISGETFDERYPVEDRPLGRYMREHQQDREERERVFKQMRREYDPLMSEHWMLELEKLRKDVDALGKLGLQLKEIGERVEQWNAKKAEHVRLLRKGM